MTTAERSTTQSSVLLFVKIKPVFGRFNEPGRKHQLKEETHAWKGTEAMSRLGCLPEQEALPNAVYRGTL